MLFCLCEERQNDKSTVFIATIDFQKLWELGFTVEDLDRDPGGFFELDQFATFSVIEVGGNTFVDSNLDLANTLLLAGEHEDACYFDRHAFCGFHQSSAFAARAVFVDAPLEARSDPLASRRGLFAEFWYVRDRVASHLAMTFRPFGDGNLFAYR